MSLPSWHPDPFQRHELRWWDGANWSDNVMDGGIAGADPIQAQVPGVGQAMPTMPIPVQQAPVAAPQKRTGLLVGGVAAVAALGIGAFVLLGGDDDSKQADTTSTIVVSTTVPAVSTTVAATTTTAPTTTTPPTTLPPGADADTLMAAMPTAADTPPDWLRASEPEPDPGPDSGAGVGICGGDNAAARALALNSSAQVSGPSWDLPSGGYFGFTAYSFESAEDASAYLDATELQADSCLTAPIVDTVPEAELDLFADGYAEEAVWSIEEGYIAYTDDTADADRLLRIVFDQYVALNYDGVDYSVTWSELSRNEQHGRMVLVFWLYGEWNFLGWDGTPDWAYSPVDVDLDAAVAAIRATLLANLDAAGAL